VTVAFKDGEFEFEVLDRACVCVPATAEIFSFESVIVCKIDALSPPGRTGLFIWSHCGVLVSSFFFKFELALVAYGTQP
jgi:hypothetical protein